MDLSKRPMPAWYCHQDMLMRIVLCFLILTGCGGRKETDVRIAVGGQGTQVNLPAMVAQELGFYKEVGLNVSLIEFPGGSKALEALMGGSAEVVCGSYDHTIQMAVEGKNLRAFVAMLTFPGMVLVSSNISSIEGLRGKTVGVTTLG
jgi:NitT/TauT family transport system substrate-binding protein